ncbi:dTDP-4-dehydrorhamnose reductase [Pontimicrobium aquaticum]|uniref:dTDP-4-dehydrorhamnose reductase n=1 Tax=Pontimicrobium aquaticum TaxID=2565367 RepID=A0A4U0EWL0_9FLAO|nr:dTDP-4-dehydrorhamnose reductase [Pontimicrobium aquaticum]TJY34772.1 dTDP-4-dehydrorhamnose reductase [Pontimicrobium aquaticum]
MSIKVLVTGANGQLGKTLEKLYKNNKDNIKFTFVTKKELDITDTQQVQNYFSNNKFNYCLNCAAYTNVEQAEKAPEIAYEVNAEAVKSLAETCNKTNTILIHISTDYVFDGEKESPYTENDLPNPINEYGKSKLLGEQYIQEILKQYFIIRTSWLYSKEFGHNFYRTILDKIKTEKELYITDAQIGCPTNTVNLSKYIYKLIYEQSSDFGIKHFCDRKAMTWFDFAKQILKENGLENKIRLVKAKKYLTFAKRPKNSMLLSSS